ncbi:hypothetical protein PINS_up000842 [Pythium insidiosum]|nr:hypothetical protein PINS_up000842 [Pythium insidiosum]
MATHQSSKRRVAAGPAKSSSLPQLLVPLATASTSNAASTSAASEGATATKCRGEFCRVALVQLTGLWYRCSARGAEDDDSNNGDGNESHVGVSRSMDDVIPDTGQRFKIGNNNVLLARAEMEFLHGRAIDDRGVGNDEEKRDGQSDEIALRWQEADNVHRMTLGRNNPALFYKQVAVCANCHRIYTEIAQLRERGFTRTASNATKKAWESRSDGPEDEGEQTRTRNTKHLAQSRSDDQTELLDQLFLAELAKHSTAGTSAGMREASSERSEADSSGQTNSDALPLLRSRKTKPGNAQQIAVPQLPLQSSQNTALDKQRSVKVHPNHALTGDVGTGQPTNVRNDTELTKLRIQEELTRCCAKLEASETQRRRLELQLVNMQAKHAAELESIEDRHRKQLLEAELVALTNGKRCGVNQPNNPTAQASSDEVARLIETVDSLNAQLDQTRDEKEKFRKELMNSHLLETRRLHERYQLEMEALRLGEHTAKEQMEVAQAQVAHLQNEAQVMASQLRNARSHVDDLMKNKIPLLEEENQRLERQVTDLKMAQSKQGAASSKGTNNQDYTAMEKHLSNKIEYLKAQLASEMKCKEDLGSHLAQLTASMESLKKEKKFALSEMEEAHKRHIDRLEASFAQEKEALMTHQASLQGKITTLQANVTDLVQDLTIWKSKENNSRLAMEKVAEENVRLNRQVVDLEGQIETLVEERSREGGSMSAKVANEETQRMQMEALLRRLDNERQYLKNQLDGANEQKETYHQRTLVLENEVHQLQKHIDEVSKQGQHQVSRLEAAISQQQRHFNDEKSIFEETKLMMARQLKDLQIKCTQLREQSIIDKDELEKARLEAQDLKSQLVVAREESLKEKEYGKSASDRMSKALTSIKGTLKAMEAEKNLKIQHLEEENSTLMEKLARSQGDVLVLDDKWTRDRSTLRREYALGRLVIVVCEKMKKMRQLRLLSALYQLRSYAKIQVITTSVNDREQRTLMELERRLQLEHAQQRDEMIQSLTVERTNALQELREAHEKDRQELVHFYEQEKAQSEEEIRDFHCKELRDVKAHHDELLRQCEETHQSLVTALEGQVNELQREKDAMSEALRESRQLAEKVAANFDSREHRYATELRERETVWAHEREELEQTFHSKLLEVEAALENQLRVAESHYEDELNRVRSEMRAHEDETLRALREELERTAEERFQALSEQYERKLLEESQRCDRIVASEREQLNDSWRTEIERREADHRKAMREGLERVEAKAQAQLVSLQKESNDRKAQALLQCTGKWQKVVDELNARLEAEKKASYEQGKYDRDQEWQVAAAQIKQKQKEELERVQDDALRAIHAAEERHNLALNAEIERVQQALKTELMSELEIAKAQIIRSEQDRHAQMLEGALQQQKEELICQHSEELEALQQRYRETLTSELDSLRSQMERERDDLVAKHAHEAGAILHQANREWEEKMNNIIQGREAEHRVALMNLEESLRQEHETERMQLEASQQELLSAQLKEQEARLLAEQEDAITQVQEDSERLIEQVEAAMSELKKQKEVLEKELTRLRSALEEAEDAQFDMSEKSKEESKRNAFNTINLIMIASRQLRKLESTRSLEIEASRVENEKKEALIRQQQMEWNEMLGRIGDSWKLLQSKQAEMLQTLTSYKRDELVAHRSASAVLSNEIAIVSKQMEEVVDMKASLEKDIEQLQAEAQGVESQLRQLMLPSSSAASSTGSTDGLNMATIAKKRRLNEEFDSLVELIERKRSELRNLEKTMSSLRQRRDEKETELKAMERKLVEILVGQQKQVLSLLQATRDIELPAPVVARDVTAG